MTGNEATRVLDTLIAAYPRQPRPVPETLALYTTALARFDLGVAMAAAARIVAGREPWPSVQRLVVACQNELDRLEPRDNGRLPAFGSPAWTSTGHAGVAKARAALRATPWPWADLDEDPDDGLVLAGAG